MVTAELAVAILAALALLGMMLWGIFLVVVELRCVDTASAVARQAARGDAKGVRMARAAAPAGASVSTSTHAGVVTVTVRVRARPWVEGLPAVPLGAQAHVAKEPGGDW
jgi:hypothetical protein